MTLRAGLISSLLTTVLFSTAVARAGQPTTTVIAHGFSPVSKGVWVQRMAQAIIARAGSGSIYRYTGASGVWTSVPAAAADGSSETIVLIFNWVPESASPAGPNWEYPQAAGDALYAALRDPRYAGAGPIGPADLAAGRALHLLGHSRGACLISEAALRFAAADLPVDQLTFMDPHPVNGDLDLPLDWGDPVPQKWSNVAFADNYWRADGGLFNAGDFDGMPIANALNDELDEDALDCCAYSTAHSDVHLWYHGTIDMGPDAGDGEQDINPPMRGSWWTDSPLGFAGRGFHYSALGGGAANRPAQPGGLTPPALPVIVNGDFDRGSRAGWSYHGGAISGQVITGAGGDYLRLGSGTGNSAVHNRFLLPVGAAAVTFDFRIVTAAPSGALALALIDQAGASHPVGQVLLMPAGGLTPVNVAIPGTVPRGRAYTLALTVPAGTSAVVELDNIDTIVQPLDPADLNGDGCVNVTDLLALIAAWGACAPPPALCPADLNGDGTTNVSDLLALIAAWGC